ncbi:MAG TPA: DUF4194 domain-containing protein [Propionibacterium sp.]|nr:DUF4194 domain-containing protein [Propionibacterium sp.]
MTGFRPRRAYSDLFPVPDPAPASPDRREERSDDRAAALFAGDPGELSEATRRALVQLLRGPYVSRRLHPKLWPALIADEAVIRCRLGDLFLELVLEPELELAFVRNLEAEELALPRVIRSSRLTLLDTALVLFLRGELLRAETGDGRVIVGRQDIDEQLQVYRPATSTDDTGFARRINSSVSKMKEHSILLGTAEEDRFEISPVLALVFTADEVLSVTAELKRLLDAAS